MLYCMDYLTANIDWLKEKLEPLEKGRSAAPFVYSGLKHPYRDRAMCVMSAGYESNEADCHSITHR